MRTFGTFAQVRFLAGTMRHRPRRRCPGSRCVSFGRENGVSSKHYQCVYYYMSVCGLLLASSVVTAVVHARDLKADAFLCTTLEALESAPKSLDEFGQTMAGQRMAEALDKYERSGQSVEDSFDAHGHSLYRELKRLEFILKNTGPCVPLLLINVFSPDVRILEVRKNKTRVEFTIRVKDVPVPEWDLKTQMWRYTRRKTVTLTITGWTGEGAALRGR